mmetsp:Transcript_12417/g.29242  ORF Transcript_12417/g.29242 Transcript_12417/m.29242 type:complete len:390 (+) Transcript_12417:28-1197(+)
MQFQGFSMQAYQGMTMQDTLQVNVAKPSVRSCVAAKSSPSCIPLQRLPKETLLTAGRKVTIFSLAAGAILQAHRRRNRIQRRATVGPMPYEAKRRAEASQDEVGRRVAYVVAENAEGIKYQLEKFGYCQIAGLLGGDTNGYPSVMRKEMFQLFKKGWFAEPGEAENATKIGEYNIQWDDSANRFHAQIKGITPGASASEADVETQYEVAPTVVSFIRSLSMSLANTVSKCLKGSLSTSVVAAEMSVCTGDGARYDRRVDNRFGWATEKGFVPDTRKLTAMYFLNPDWKEDLGGMLQLENVITPTGTAKVPPVSDILILFWSDRVVWSVSPSQAMTPDQHRYALHLRLVAEDRNDIKYDPKSMARYFPQLEGLPVSVPEEGPPANALASF